MTIWNWIALIAFVIALVSGLNAFLSLKARWLDWSGVRSKKKFDKRLKELKNQIGELVKYQNNPSQFFPVIAEWVLQIFLMFLLAFLTVVLTLLLTAYPSNSYFVFFVKPVLGFVAVPMLFWAVIAWSNADPSPLERYLRLHVQLSLLCSRFRCDVIAEIGKLLY